MPRGPAPESARFNVITLEHAEAIVRGAETASRAAILQSARTPCVPRRAGPIAAATVAVARAASVPAAVHLDHATEPALVREAVSLGLGSVMFDASALEYEANVAATAAVVAQCHEAGVWVEAELGEVGGKDGVHAPGARPNPDEALAYVEATAWTLGGCRGQSHAMLTRDAVLDDST